MQLEALSEELEAKKKENEDLREENQSLRKKDEINEQKRSKVLEILGQSLPNNVWAFEVNNICLFRYYWP